MQGARHHFEGGTGFGGEDLIGRWIDNGVGSRSYDKARNIKLTRIAVHPRHRFKRLHNPAIGGRSDPQARRGLKIGGPMAITVFVRCKLIDVKGNRQTVALLLKG